MLHVARSSVHAYLADRELRLPEMESLELDGIHGVFVSIHRGSDLRGCVGTLGPEESLYRSVAGCAVAAASRDPRFTPVQLVELPDLQFEISVLFQLQDVTNIEFIEIGVHGLIVSKENSRGLLLPQVAVQHHWNREQFLSETCRKAGLPPGAWRQGAHIQSFIAEVFS